MSLMDCTSIVWLGRTTVYHRATGKASERRPWTFAPRVERPPCAAPFLSASSTPRVPYGHLKLRSVQRRLPLPAWFRAVFKQPPPGLQRPPGLLRQRDLLRLGELRRLHGVPGASLRLDSNLQPEVEQVTRRRPGTYLEPSRSARTCKWFFSF
jgi:hypothetical protein